MKSELRLMALAAFTVAALLGYLYAFVYLVTALAKAPF